MKYRAEIDGLRAIAVVPVVFFHAGLDVFSGGFIGVDVFFVISGYLITSILLHDLEKEQFSLLKFYERRTRRILPALFFVVLCSIPFAWLWMMPAELEDFGLSLIGVATFTSNILFWQQSGYFAASAELKPMLHTWSLAVEEQYYILFPIFLAFVWSVRRNWILASLIILGVASLALAQWATQNIPTANYYLVPMRFWEIAVGSICAVLLWWNVVRPNLVAAAVGVALVVVAMVQFTAATPTPSVWTLIPVAGTAMIILFARDDNPIATFLGNRIFVSIGLVSYSAYLWHQPLIAFFRLRTAEDPRGIALAALVLGTFVLAWFSWRYVERPFRATPESRLSQGQILKMGAGVLVALAGVGIFLASFNGHPSRLTPAGESFAEIALVNEDLRPNAGLHMDCDTKHFALPSNCRTSPRPGTVLWGDSYAMQLAPALVASETKIDFAQVTKSSCGPFPGISAHFGKARWWQCTEFNDKALDWIVKTDEIRMVIASSAFSQLLYPTYARDGSIFDPADLEDKLVRNILSTQSYLKGRGKRMIFVAPPPQNGESLGLCFVRKRIFGQPFEECNFERDEITARNVAITRILKRIETSVPVIWFDDFLCDQVICKTSFDKISIYRDSGHLSVPGSTELGRRVDLMGIIQQEVSGPR